MARRFSSSTAPPAGYHGNNHTASPAAVAGDAPSQQTQKRPFIYKRY